MIRGIGLRGAVAINVITMIGIGPLITIPLVLSQLHGSTALVAWVVGAVIALCDGLAWAELGSMYPGSGGTYVFLRETFGRERWGRLLAFLFAWQIVLSAPLVLASGYIGFANYAGYLWPALASDTHAQAIVAAALAIVTLVALYRPIRTVGTIGIALAGIAVATLAAVIASAATRFSPGRAFSADSHVGFLAALTAGLGPALVITLYDYYGYGQACTLGDEVLDTKRVLPRSVIVSIVLVAALYIALQVGVLGIVPWHELVPGPDGVVPAAANYVASLVVERTLGSWPARIVTIAILATAFASTFGNLLGYSRIPFSAARDGVFLKPFANLDARGRFPTVSLVAIGLLAIPACFLSLGDVISALTTGLVIIQSLAQLAAIIALRVQKIRAPYRMTLFPLPLVVAAAGWLYIFASSGGKAIAFGIVSLIAGIAIYAVRAGRQREWPFARTIALVLFATVATCAAVAVPGSKASAAELPTPAWGRAATIERAGNPTFEVDGTPFFVYGAAFFYERLPRDRWAPSMEALKKLGINTLDLYVPWNWHELSDGDFDFSGRTNPRRDLDEVLRLARRYDFKIILRPGPVIRNEWRNGGYPAWLLARPEYGMPEHDLLEGRYPPTATLQNQHSDDAAAAWMNNATHISYARRWIERVLHACAPDADLVLAVALDDDQGAYIDNQTYPAPHLARYLGWLRDVVHVVTGPREPVFINTYQMKVTASSPVWAMGNWYQSEAFSIGEHDRAQLEFSMGLLHTRPHQPMMASEFQAGWLEQPGDNRPRGADPSNTGLALATMFGLGMRGFVNFPAQDTMYPAGWEAPFANGFYAWDAALALDERATPRAEPTATFGALAQVFGPELAIARTQFDAAVLYLGGSLRAQENTNGRFADVASATITAQQACRDAGLACTIVDPAAVDEQTLRSYPLLLVPDISGGRAPLRADVSRILDALGAAGRPAFAASTPREKLLQALRSRGHRFVLDGIPSATFASVDDGTLDGFLSVTNYSDAPETIAHGSVLIGTKRRFLPAFVVEPHRALVVPIGVRLARFVNGFRDDDELSFLDCMPAKYVMTLSGGRDSRALQLLWNEQFNSDGRATFVSTYRQATGCHIYARVHGAQVSDTVRGTSTFLEANERRFLDLVSDPFGGPGNQPGIAVRSDTNFPTTAFAPVPAAGTVAVYEADVYRDGEADTVLDNGTVRVVIAPQAGARAFVFEDETTQRNCFTTVGALRDDIAIEPPLSTVDRIAKYTHQFPAGTFNRTYRATLAQTPARASFSDLAPDIGPGGVTFVRSIALEPGAHAFAMDEQATFAASADPQQRAVSVSSLAVGDTAAMTTQSIFAPTASAFVARTTLHVTQGNALGFYDAATHEFATIAWHAGDVEDASLEERDSSIVVRLTLARDRVARLRYGYDTAPSSLAATTALAAADGAAQRLETPEKGPLPTPRTL